MKTNDERMQEIMPGSSTFQVRVMCPVCGWHFKDGLTDPSGENKAMVAGIALVCSKCITLLMTTDTGLVVFPESKLKEMDPDERMLLEELRTMTAAMRAMMGPPDDQGTVQ